MVNINFLVTALAALIPLIVGAIWYNPKVFGSVWLKSTGLSEEELKKANMAKVFGLTYVFSLLIAIILNPIVIHQFGFQSMLMGEADLLTEGSEANLFFTTTLEKYGTAFRTFKHGMLHGTINGLLFATPVIGIVGLFERKGAKYILVHAGYWILTLGLMGGVIGQFP
ncbi:MAG: DUF1761 domain-containing protein [Flavipsychrobacter sp.]